jgi:hypothetical protein
VFPACPPAHPRLLERLVDEGRRRTRIIPHAFSEHAVLKLMHAALISPAERWRRLRLGEFEGRQLAAIRNECYDELRWYSPGCRATNPATGGGMPASDLAGLFRVRRGSWRRLSQRVPPQGG